MRNAAVVPQVKVRSALRLTEGDVDTHHRRQFVFEFGGARHCVESGFTYPSVLGPITVLSIAERELWYFQGGLVYCVSNPDFINLVQNLRIRGTTSATGSSHNRSITEVEAEFILGIVSAVGPMACWTLLGNDLVSFIRSKSQPIANWTSQIASLFLARMILKNYAIKLYQKLSGLHAERPWSNLTEAVATDDIAIFRFVGHLLGIYGSDHAVDQAIHLRWSIFSCIFQALESLLDAPPGTEERASRGRQTRVEEVVSSLGRLGINLFNSDVQSLLQAVHQYPNEIKKSIELLRSAFEDGAP
jgi:hypothetical protein